MNLFAKRVVESGCRSRLEAARRLGFWADRYGFTRDEDDGEDFVFKRGSQWSAVYTFDIRKVPTEARVTWVASTPGLCICTMNVASWLQMPTPGDETLLSEQMDLLEACLKAALGAQAPSAEVEIEESVVERKSRSHHIKPA
jgi:hypothetical protein